MQRTNIYLEPRQTEALDRLAGAEGVSRAELVRRIIDRALGGGDDTTGDLAAIEASFGALNDVEAPIRGRGTRQAHLDELWATTP